MHIVFIIIALFVTFPLFSIEEKPISIDKKLSDYNTFIMPLDFTKKPRYALKVLIPNGFTTTQSPDQFNIRLQETILEYIPNNENIDDWSEIITVTKLVGRGAQAIDFNETLKKNLLANNEKGKILFSSSSKEKSIEHSSFLMEYTYQNQEEIVGISYFSGPSGLAGAQYTIRLKGGQTKTDAVNKIGTFFRNNFGIVSTMDF